MKSMTHVAVKLTFVDAAIAIHGQALKKDLKQSPFVVYFELGANNEGYWT